MEKLTKEEIYKMMDSSELRAIKKFALTIALCDDEVRELCEKTVIKNFQKQIYIDGKPEGILEVWNEIYNDALDTAEQVGRNWSYGKSALKVFSCCIDLIIKLKLGLIK